MNSETKSDWTDAFQELRPNVTPGSALTARVAALAASEDAARRTKHVASRRFLRLSAGLTLAAAAAIIAVSVVVGPKMVFARTLRTVSLNFLAARGYHSRIQYLHNGRTWMQTDVWCRDGKWRQDSDVGGKKFTQIRAGGKFINFRAGTDCATSQTAGRDNESTVNLVQLRAEIQHTLSNPRSERINGISRDGRNLMGVAESAPVTPFPFMRPRPGRSLVWIDTEKMLPVISETQILSQGKWETVVQVDFDFEHPVSDSKFTIPSDIGVMMDLNSYGVMAGNRFRKPIAQSSDARARIAVRDAQVNRDGDVFILYTDGSTRADWKQDCSFSGDIKDDIGTPYAGTAVAIQPFMYCENARESRGITVGRETMQGLCLVPAFRSPSHHLPRRITLRSITPLVRIRKHFA